jgi:hypothetical protein
MVACWFDIACWFDEDGAWLLVGLMWMVHGCKQFD